MKLFHLVWRNLLRKKLRTLFTVLSILVAFLLFGYLSAIGIAFSMGVDITGADRLISLHKVSLIQPLPVSYLSRIEAVPGVIDVAHGTWFGGIYQDPKNFFAQMAVSPERFLALYPEYLLSQEEKKVWFATRTGAIVGRKTAERFGWKIGDRIPIQGTIWRKSDGGSLWEFDLVGIYDGDQVGVDDTQFFFHHEYLSESNERARGIVGWYIIRIDDPENAVTVAEQIDANFANSFYETETSTEKAFVQAFANQVGNIGKILRLVMTAVFFTILLVAGNTMAQSVRERVGELAVLKTLGFSGARLLRMVLTESLLVAGFGGGLGLGLGWLLIHLGGDPTQRFLPIFYFPGRDLAIGIVLVVLLGLAAGIVPALRALRLGIVDALRRT